MIGIKRYGVRGLTPFVNPNNEGPCEAVKYCPADDMFHIVYRESPFKNDRDYFKIGLIISNALDFNEVAAGERAAKRNQFELQDRPLKTRKDLMDEFDLDRKEARYVSINCDHLLYCDWAVDLDNLPEKLALVPILQTEWLEDEITALKKRNGFDVGVREATVLQTQPSGPNPLVMG